MRSKRLLLLIVAVAMALGFVVLLAAQREGPPQNRQPAVPRDGTSLFGVQLDWERDTPAGYAHRLGRVPSVYGAYISFPLSASDKAKLSNEIDDVRRLHAKLMLTLMPNAGLSAVTSASTRDLGKTLAGYNARGVEVFVRFGHEMNGSWYAWSQRPEAFIASFRAVADMVHNYAPKSAMVWAPNYSGGYPFNGGSYNAKPGTADFAALDTNRDGVLNMSDDPYAPYYPGDGYVDWVALTLYHYGNVWPWGENEVPEPDKFVQNVTGTYDGLGGDERILPDFYAEYAVSHGKPFAIAETSAFYNPAKAGIGADDYEIKSHWWAQLYDHTIPLQFPELKMVLWFEHEKEEIAGSTVDWTVTYDPGLLRGFRASLPPWLIFAEGQRRPRLAGPGVRPLTPRSRRLVRLRVHRDDGGRPPVS